MAETENKSTASPTLEQLETELYREKYRSRYKTILRSTVYALVIVAAVSVLIATLLLPVLQIYGNSMSPTLEEGEIVVSVKSSEYATGDVIALYFNNRIIIKRIIACAGQWISIDEHGNVYVDGNLLDEPYLIEKHPGTTNIEYPIQVPENSYFVLGDHRETSVDSRNSVIGCINKDEIVGKIIFKVWPLSKFGLVE